MGWKTEIVNVSGGLFRTAPTARPHTSPGQRPGKRMKSNPRAEGPAHFRISSLRGHCAGYCFGEMNRADGALVHLEPFSWGAAHAGMERAVGPGRGAVSDRGDDSSRRRLQSEREPTGGGSCRWRNLCNSGCCRSFVSGEGGSMP